MALRTADEIKLDIDEIESLLPQAKRQKTKDLLTLEVRKLQTELIQVREREAQKAQEPTEKPQIPSQNKCYTVKLTNYAWDESDKYMKLYVTLKNVQSLPADQVTCDFTERSMHLYANGLDNKNYELAISDLCERIDPSKSYTKIKTDMIVVFLAKEVQKQWSHVTGIEKRMKEAKNSTNMSDPSDPEASLMNLMKKMYQDGDDDMKRTIAKAWTESQEKKGLVDDMPRMPMV